MEERKCGFVPEWAPQEAVILAWPDHLMDWRDNLSHAQACYAQIIDALLHRVNVVLLVDELTDIPQEKLKAWQSEYAHKLIVVDGFRLNDTWMRDVMPLFGVLEGHKVAYDYGFNGWGLKYASNHDNTATRRLFFERKLFSEEVLYKNYLDVILEGGAIEVNSRGDLLTTSSVLWQVNRNPNFLIGRYESYFDPRLQLNVHDLEEPLPMAGDDTDGHIDTLARFTDDATIVYNDTSDEADKHFASLQKLEAELTALRGSNGEPFRCVPLPIPAPIYDAEGQRLPATYANFLITNGAVLLPTYDDEMDAVAIVILRELFPEHEVIGIDCRALVEQHGSLHCITMQVPVGYLNKEWLKR